jgi:hypothetical protein
MSSRVKPLCIQWGIISGVRVRAECEFLPTVLSLKTAKKEIEIIYFRKIDDFFPVLGS